MEGGKQLPGPCKGKIIISNSQFPVALFGMDRVIVVKLCAVILSSGSAFGKVKGREGRGCICTESIVQKVKIVFGDIRGIHMVYIIPRYDGSGFRPQQGDVKGGYHSQAIGELVIGIG